MVDICRQFLGRHQPLAEPRVTFHDKGLVETHQIIDPVEYEEIVSDCHFRCGQIPSEQSQPKKRGVEHYVAVIGDERIVHTWIIILHSSERDAGCGRLGKHLQKGEHDLMLEIILVVHLLHFIEQHGDIFLGHCIIHRVKKAGIYDQAGHLLLED